MSDNNAPRDPPRSALLPRLLLGLAAIAVLAILAFIVVDSGFTTDDIDMPRLVGLLGIQLAALWRYTPGRLATEVAQSPALADPSALFAAGDLARREALERGVVGGVATPLFQTYLVPFEITSVLLLAAIVGAVVLAKRRI